MGDKNGWWDTEDDIDETSCAHGIDAEDEFTKLLVDEINQEKAQEVKEAMDEEDVKYGIGVVDREKDELVQAMMLDNMPTVFDMISLIDMAGDKIKIFELLDMEITIFTIKNGGDI